MELFFTITTYISWVLLVVLAVKAVTFASTATLHHRRHTKSCNKKLNKPQPLVSVIVPCYNEETVLENCIKSLLKQNYKNIEIILVNDGSTDNTQLVANKLVQHNPLRIISLTKANGGKANALNYGLRKATGEIVVSMDADSMFLKNTVKELALTFCDPAVMAVSGNVKVANRNKFLGKEQALEYITGLTLQRKAFALLGCMQVISGAIGAFRRSALLEIGGYSSDTIVEDMDVTISLLKAGHKVEYNCSAIAYTEAPESISGFIKQRYRWVYGGFQVLKKHKDMIFNPRYGKAGLIGVPYFMLFPWVDVLISFLFGVALLRVMCDGSLISLLLFYLGMSLAQGLLVGYALLLDREDKALIFVSVVDSLWYNHLISLITMHAGFNFLRGVSASWNKLPRLGRNVATVTH